MLFHWDSSPLGERLLEGRQVERIWPVAFARCSQDFENLKDLVDLTVTSEQGSALSHLGEDASSRPQINSERISFLA